MIWWKRIPGGDYVYPVQATVLVLTAKRVKIEADDDGEIVIGMFHRRVCSVRDDSMRVRGRFW